MSSLHRTVSAVAGLRYHRTMTDTNRLEALEVRIAHQDAIIDDLNQTVTKQWREIDRLTREVTKLADRLAAAELHMGDPGDEPPPPHY